jgi:NitT/TauT family transport system ATP-binding protein
VFLADRIVMFSARPATIIEQIQVGEHIAGQRELETKETQAFFHLRNHVLEAMRVQARRTEELERAGAI